MAGKISSFTAGVQAHDGARSASIITANTRARTTRGFIGLVSDVIMFPDGTGAWFMPNQRVRINNIPTIGASSTGVSTSVDLTAGAMLVVDSDSRVGGM